MEDIIIEDSPASLKCEAHLQEDQVLTIAISLVSYVCM